MHRKSPTSFGNSKFSNLFSHKYDSATKELSGNFDNDMVDAILKMFSVKVTLKWWRSDLQILESSSLNQIV